MYYIYHKKKYPDSILVYIEEYNRFTGMVLFDFVDSNEFAIFGQNANLPSGTGRASMVRLTNYSGRRIQENTVYAISLETLGLWRREQRIRVEDNSFLVGYNVELTHTEPQVFERSVTIGTFDDFQLSSFMTAQGHLQALPFAAPNVLKVKVRDVGQGNWNEVIANDQVKVVFDAGAPLNASRAEVIRLIGTRPATYASDKPGLILSHWDKDHYHSLIGMTNAELSNFSYFICRDRVPNYTSRILFGRIRAAIPPSSIYCIPAVPRVARGGRTSLIPYTPSGDPHILFNGQHHKDRNVSGLVLALRTSASSIILSGDSHYSQLEQDVLPYLNYPHHHHLVVPHHGGKAGGYTYSLPTGVVPRDAVISVGANSYGHPRPAYTSALGMSGFRTQRTDRVGDIIITL